MNLRAATLLLALTSCDAAGRPVKAAHDDEQCSAPGSCDAEAEDAPPCTLYLAPSSIPDAGLGLFSGRKIPKGESVHEHLSFCEEEDEDFPFDQSAMWFDIFIPVWNRGNRPFASWMGYVWPESPGALWNDEDGDRFVGDEGLAFADKDAYLAEDGRRTEDGDGGLISPVSAYAFGLASLANSHPKLHNMVRDTSLFEELEQKENHMGLLFPGQTSYPEDAVMLNAPWDAGVGAFAPTHGNDFVTTKKVKAGTELLLHYGKRWHKRHKRRSAEEGEAPAAAADPQGEKQAVRSPEWLAENGVCLFSAALTSAPSRIPHAGRGAFANRAAGAGEVLAVSPMLAVARGDLKVAHSHNDADQVMVNYGFGHPESSVLIVPLAPVVGYVNHSLEKPNAVLRWPRAGSDAQKLFGDPNAADGGLLALPVAEVLTLSGKFAVEYVALRDIEEGEEIVLSYGEGWEELWSHFAKMHPYERPGYFRREAGVPDGFWPEAWLDLAA